MTSTYTNISGGLLIVFEGIDGSGKTTQLKQAEQTLHNDNWLIASHRNPGGTPIGEALREVMLGPIPRPAKTDLYVSAAIHEALIETFQAERAEGAVILLDRGPLSMAAYQIYGSGLDEKVGWQYVNQSLEDMHPDLTIIYKCTPEIGLDRARKHADHADYFESKPLSYFQDVARGYDAVAERYGTVVIDATQSIEAIHEQTMQHIHELLRVKSSPDA